MPLHFDHTGGVQHTCRNWKGIKDWAAPLSKKLERLKDFPEVPALLSQPAGHGLNTLCVRIGMLFLFHAGVCQTDLPLPSDLMDAQASPSRNVVTLG